MTCSLILFFSLLLYCTTLGGAIHIRFTYVNFGMPEGSALQGQHCTLPSLIMPHGSDSLSLNTPLAFSLCTHALFHIWSRCAFTVWICVSISMLSASQDCTTWPAQHLLQSKPSIKVSYMNPFHIPSWTDQIPLW